MLKKSVVGVLALLCVVSVPRAFACGDKSKVEEIIGTVIAYDVIKRLWIPCSDVCDGSVIVLIDSPVDSQPPYTRVDFKGKYGELPKLLVESGASRKQLRLRLIRTSNLDELLEEFIRYNDVPNKKFPIWVRFPGAKDEKLPFGAMLPSYSLVKGGIKLVSGK